MPPTQQADPAGERSGRGNTRARDGSVTLYFGPDAPAGNEANWVETIPGKGWFVLLRLYGPLEAWFDRSWQPGEFERLD